MEEGISPLAVWITGEHITSPLPTIPKFKPYFYMCSLLKDSVSQWRKLEKEGLHGLSMC